MKFSEFNDQSALIITSYDDDHIAINERPYYSSLVITRQQTDPDWAPAKPYDISIDTIKELLDYQPEIILLGTGSKIVFPEPEAMVLCAQAGVGLEVMDSPSACRTYNVLLSEEREIVAGLLLPGA
jgi:uncharacterized protein